MNPARQHSRVVTAQDAALADLRERIASGQLRPGEQIRQEQLAAALGLSVVPLREALKTLEAEGQVVYAPHRGYFVARLSLKELTEAYRIRRLLEDEAVARAVPRLGAEDESRMRDAIRDIDEAGRAGDLLAVAAANKRFHFTLFDAADMPRLGNFIRMLWDSTDPYRSLYFVEEQNRRLLNDEHALILSAVRDGDARQAIKLLRIHRSNAIEALAAVLVERNP
jgi:DNA-binding GntR family transcriptional regulator